MAFREKSLILSKYHWNASKIKNQSYSRFYDDCDVLKNKA